MVSCEQHSRAAAGQYDLVPCQRSCSLAEVLGMAIDTSVPVLQLGGGKQCQITATTSWGQVLYLANYLLQALGWAFATLFVAGYTGLVRKTGQTT